MSGAIGCWIHPFQESRIWFIGCLRPVLGLFYWCSFYSISYSSSSVSFLSQFKLLPCSIQCEWHLDPSYVPISRSNTWKTLLCMFQWTHAFHFRVLALLRSLASKLQVEGEQQVGVCAFKHLLFIPIFCLAFWSPLIVYTTHLAGLSLTIYFSYQILDSSTFPITQKGCISIVVWGGTWLDSSQTCFHSSLVEIHSIVQ